MPRLGSDEVERVMGIEPTLVAWEATVLPLNYTRRAPGFYASGRATGNWQTADDGARGGNLPVSCKMLRRRSSEL